MLVSLKEISKYVDIKDLTPEEISKRLTFSGIEIEGIKKGIEATNLVIGEVISCEDHPDSDHLHVTKVNIGDEILQIVCGAPNVKKGAKVIVAKVGAKLPNIEIKKGTIRGIESCGMLCALNELGVDPKFLREEQIKGIELLPHDAQVGNEKVAEYLGYDDIVLDLSLLANRSDCYAIFNVAREIGALFNKKVFIPQVNDDKTYIENNFKVLSMTDSCKEFSVKIVKGIEVKESPLWLKRVLNSEGIRSINNIVDLGNYIMLLTGQPLHMYDLDSLNNELIVKDGFNQEYVALDDKTYKIEDKDIVVTSNNEIMCLGGVIGGKTSEVKNTTKNIAIEVANFEHAQIRKTCNRLGISSDSSLRFIKGINKNQVDFVLNLTTSILKEISSVREISNVIKYDVLNHDERIIDCSKNYINKRLGTDFTLDEIVKTLRSLYFKIEVLDDDNFKAIVPDFRIDIDGKADLSEEVIRYLGLDNIKSILPTMDTTVGKLKEEDVKTRLIEDYLIMNNFNQVLTYSLISKKEIRLFNFLNNDEAYKISNPITEEHEFVRTSTIYSLIKCASYNLNHQQNNFKIFEISGVNTKNSQYKYLSAVFVGKELIQDNIEGNFYSYYDAKGILDSIITMFNIQESRIKIERVSKDNKELHPLRSALIYIDNKLFAILGEIHPSIKKELGLIKNSMIVLEMNLSILFKTKTKNNHYGDISRYPSSTRDYAFIIDKKAKWSDIKKEIKKISNIIKIIDVFDIYEGEYIDNDHISIALRVKYEDYSRTLKEEEIVDVDKKIKEMLSNKFKAEFRG